jgi:hypothetical protein
VSLNTSPTKQTGFALLAEIWLLCKANLQANGARNKVSDLHKLVPVYYSRKVWVNSCLLKFDLSRQDNLIADDHLSLFFICNLL